MTYQIGDYLQNKQKRQDTSNEAGECRKCKANVLWRRDKLENHISTCNKTEACVKAMFMNAKKKRKAPPSPVFSPINTSSQGSSTTLAPSDSVSCGGEQKKLTSYFRSITPEFAAEIDSKVECDMCTSRRLLKYCRDNRLPPTTTKLGAHSMLPTQTR